MWKSIKTKLKFEHSRRDLKKLIFWRDVICELWVSTFLMAVVIIILNSNNLDSYKPGVTHFGLFAGFFVFMLLEAYGPISCLAHPPVTFSFFLVGKLSFAKAFVFTAVQVLGCAVGSGIGYALTPVSNRKYQAFNPALNGLSWAQGVFVEALFTMNLIFVVLSTHGDDYPRKFSILPNLAIGCAVGTSILAAGTYTGGFMNPLISLGPAILTGDFTNHWIYWVGPYVGLVPGVLLHIFYVWVKNRDDDIPMRVIPPSTETMLVESDY